jgi:hypothetical protein
MQRIAFGVCAGRATYGGNLMRRLWLTAAAGLALTSLVGSGLLRGEAPPSQIVPDKTEQTCGSYGTQIEFMDSPAEAAKKAKKENKLVFILHVSGNFEDPKFT